MQAKGLLGLCKAHPGVKPVSKAYWRSLMPDKGSAERVTGTFNEPGFSTKAVDMSIPCSWVSTLLSSWPGARAHRGQWHVTVALLTGSYHQKHQTESLVPRGQKAPTQEPRLPFPFLSRYPLFMLGCAVLFHVPGSRPFVYLYTSFSCIPQQGYQSINLPTLSTPANHAGVKVEVPFRVVRYTTLWFLWMLCFGHVLRASGSFGTSRVCVATEYVWLRSLVKVQMSQETQRGTVGHLHTFSRGRPGESAASTQKPTTSEVRAHVTDSPFRGGIF